MIVFIFLLAFLLAASGLGVLYASLNLVPTDLGMAYLQAGTVLMSTATLVLALGLATRLLSKRLLALAVPPASLAETSRIVQSPTATAEPYAEAPGFGTIAAAGAAGIAAGAVATGLVAEGGAPRLEEAAEAAPALQPDPDRLVEDMERELFDKESFVPVTPAEIAGEAIPLVEAKAAEEAAEAEKDVGDDPEQEIEPVVPIVAPPDTARSELRAEPPPSLTDAALPSMEALDREIADFLAAPDARKRVDSGVEAAAVQDVSPVAEAPVAEISEEGAAEAMADLPPLRPEIAPLPATEPVIPAAPEIAPAPGLIPDADLAAIEADVLPPLAPLSSLEIVGAYDSGGTRFTMYSDGSVTASGPQGERRFRSLDELRRHIDPAA